MIEDRYRLDETYHSEFFDSNDIDSMPFAIYIVPFLIEKFNIKRVLDIGCGRGHYVKCFQMYGAESYGVDGATNNRTWCDRNSWRKRDLRDPMPMYSRIDFVMSIEVAEHIEEPFADIYVDNITKHEPNTILMTAAPPGQGGPRHENCQEKYYWIDKLFKRGYKATDLYYNDIEAKVNKADEVRINIPYWFLPNHMIFEKV